MSENKRVMEFTKEGVTIKVPMHVPIIGNTMIERKLSYEEMKDYKFSEEIYGVTPEFDENGRLTKLIFYLGPVSYSMKTPSNEKTRFRLGYGSSHKIPLGSLRLVGSFISPQRRVEMTVYQYEDIFYLQSPSAKKHTLRHLQNLKKFKEMLKWLRQQLLPEYFTKLEKKAIREKLCNRSEWWDFFAVALARGAITYKREPNRTLILIS